MNRISLAAILVSITTLCFGQGELNGKWIKISYEIDGSVSDVQDRLGKERLTFNSDGQYVRTWHESELPEGASLRLSYELLDGKVTKTYFDKTGKEIKVVRIKKKSEAGTFEKSASDDSIRFLAGTNEVRKQFKVEGKYLFIADTVNNHVIWSRYKKKG